MNNLYNSSLPPTYEDWKLLDGEDPNFGFDHITTPPPSPPQNKKRKRDEVELTHDYAIEHLIKLGYSEKFARDLLKKDWQEKYHSVVLHNGKVEELHLDKKLLLGVAREKSLGPLVNNFTALRNLNFKPKQIYRMAANVCAKDTLPYVVNEFDTLIGRVETGDNIVKLVAHSGAVRTIHILFDIWNPMRTLGFTQDHLVHVANRNGGGQCLQALSTHARDLLGKGYTQDAVVSLVSGVERDKTIKKILKTSTI